MSSQQYSGYHSEERGSLEKIETQRTGPLPDSKETASGISDESISPLAQRIVTASSKHHHFRAALGLHRKAPIDQEHDQGGHHEHLWPRIRLVLREPMCELFGVMIMVLFGDGSVAQVLLSQGSKDAPAADGFGPYQSISWGWALGVMLGIYVAGDSGAFLNPAITFAFCVYRRFPFRRWPIYLLAQCIGGFCAAGILYAVYIPAINHYAGHGVRKVPPEDGSTAQIFCTYPAKFLTNSQQFVSEFICSSILIFVVFALKDESNKGAALGARNWFPLALFFLIFGLGACFGWETGYAMNPARDFPPRLFSYIVGYGPEVFTSGHYYFWVPIVAPMCGTLFGGFLYDAFIYTGPESPVNTPYLGLPYLIKPWEWIRLRQSERTEEIPAPANFDPEARR